MINLVYKAVWTISLLGTVGFSLWRGRRVERIFAMVLLAACCFTAWFTYDPLWNGMQWSSLVVQLLFLGTLLGIALKSDRWWPMWTAAFQVIATLILVLPAIDPRTRAYAAFVGLYGWDYLTLLSLVVGTAREAKAPASIASVCTISG